MGGRGVACMIGAFNIFIYYLYFEGDTCVMAAGCSLVIPISTFVRDRYQIPVLGTRRVITATRSGMVQNTIYTLGGHALASPKGGRPCPLNTLNYEVAGYLVFR